MKKYFIHLLTLTLIVGMAACGSKDDSEGSDSEAFDDAQKPKGETETFDELIVNLPAPSEIPHLLFMTGADYNESLINPYTNIDKYQTTEETRALNLGVYGADLGYLSSYDKTQGAINYMSSMQKLADELGASSYDLDMIDRFESNLGNKDSLYTIIDQGMAEADQILKSEDRGDIAAMLTVGSFVEGMYISTQLVAQYPTGTFTEEQKYTVLTPLIRVILEQENSLNELIRLAGSIDNDEMTSIVSKLSGLQAQYGALDIEDKLNNNEGELLLNNQTLKNITEQVAALRSSIVD